VLNRNAEEDETRQRRCKRLVKIAEENVQYRLFVWEEFLFQIESPCFKERRTLRELPKAKE
jgi:hypothetical protein